MVFFEGGVIAWKMRKSSPSFNATILISLPFESEPMAT